MAKVDKEPVMIPNSKAINIVPAPTPLRFSGDRSAVQANNVGLETPVANPKMIAAIMYELTLSAEAMSIILAIKNAGIKILVSVFQIFANQVMS